MAMGGCGDERAGMIAVVRGLPDAGLAVTLLDGKHQYTLQPDNLQHHTSTSTYKSTAETGTEAQLRRGARLRDSIAQASDDRYASSYQISHCNVRPTSPPVEITEFPPQRPEPRRGHGNFVVGGSGSGERKFSPTRVTDDNYRGGMVWPDRGSVWTSRCSKDVDTFANSLRKYPSLSPERSTDLVERLITYTQSKNRNTNPRIINGRRVNPNESNNPSNRSSVIAELKKFHYNTCTKNLQTYTRTNKCSKLQETPTKESHNKSVLKNEKEFGEMGRESPKYELGASPTYDYLAPKINKAIDKMDYIINNKFYNNKYKSLDVRYLCGMTTNIRNKIKNICEEAPVLGCVDSNCPKYRERLMQHRKKHHIKYENKTSLTGSSQMQASSNIILKEAATSCLPEPCEQSTAVSCSPSTITCHHSTRFDDREIRPSEIGAFSRLVFDTKSIQTCVSSKEYSTKSIESMSDMRNSVMNTEATYCVKGNRLKRLSKSDELISKYKFSENKLQSVVRRWLLEVPVYQNESVEEKKQRELMIARLEHRLKMLTEQYQGDDLDALMRFEIEKTLSGTPMWCPNDEREKVVFLDNIINNLVTNISGNKNTNRFGSFSNGSIVIERFQCKRSCRNDKFMRAIFMWVQSLPTQGEDCQQLVDPRELTIQIDQILRPIALKRPRCKSMYKKILKENIVEFLHNVPMRKFCCNKEEYLNHLAQKLTDELSCISLENEEKIPSSCCSRGLNIKDANKSTVDITMQNSITEEVNEVLEHSQIHTTRDERATVVNDISSILMRSIEVMRGADEDQTKNELVSILQHIPDVSVPAAVEVADDILTRFREISVLDTTGPDRSYFSDGSKIDSPRIRMSTPKRDFDSRNTIAFPDVSIIDTSDNDIQHKEAIEIIIEKWLNEISLKFSERRKNVRELTDTIAHLKKHTNVKGPKHHDALKEHIMGWMKKVPTEKSKRMSLNQASERLIELLNSIADRFSLDQSNKPSTTPSNKKDIEDQISYWLYELPIDIEATENIQELKKDLINTIKRNRENDRYLRNEIIKWLGLVPMSSEFDTRKPEMAEKLIVRINKLNNDPQKRQLESSIIDPIRNEISIWINDLPIGLKSSDIKDLMIKELATEIGDRQRYLEDNPSKKLSKGEENGYLEYQIYRWLYKIPTDVVHPSELVEKLGPNVKELINKINKLKTDLEISKNKNVPFGTGQTDREIESPNKFARHVTVLEDQIDQWLNTLPITLDSSFESQRKVLIKDLAQHLKQIQIKYENVDNEEFLKDKVVEDVSEWLKKVPLQSERNKKSHREEFALFLYPIIRDIAEVASYDYGTRSSITTDSSPIGYSTYNTTKNTSKNITSSSKPSPESFNKSLDKSIGQSNIEQSDSAKVFSEDIITWCNRLPIFTGDTQEERKRREAVLLKLVFELFQKISFLGADEIAKDDITFKRILEEQINIMLDSLPQSPQLDSVKRVMAAELVETIYKHKKCFIKSETDKRLTNAVKIPNSSEITDEKFAFHNSLIQWAHGVSCYFPNIPHNEMQELQMIMICNILCKVFELTDNPTIVNDKNLFVDLIIEETEKQLDQLPYAPQLQRDKHQLALKLAYEITVNVNVFHERRRLQRTRKDRTAEGPAAEYKSFERGVGFRSSINQPVSRQTQDITNGKLSKSIEMQSIHTSLQSTSIGTFHDSQWPSTAERSPQPTSRPLNIAPSSYGSPQREPFVNQTREDSPNKRPRASLLESPYGLDTGQHGGQRSLSQSRKMLSQHIKHWCDQLPIYQGNSEAERHQKEGLQIILLYQIFHKAYEIASDLDIFYDNILFEELIEKEIESVLDSLPMNPDLQRNKRSLALELAKQIADYKECFAKRDQTLNKTSVHIPNQSTPKDRLQLQQNRESLGSRQLGVTPEESPGYQTFQRQVVIRSSPNQAGIENESILQEVGRRKEWFSPHPLQDSNDQHFTSLYSTRLPNETSDGEILQKTNRSQRQEMLDNQKNIDAFQKTHEESERGHFASSNLPMSHMQRQQHPGFQNLNSTQRANFTGQQDYVNNAPVHWSTTPNSNQIEAGSQTEVKSQYRQIARHPEGATASLQRNTMVDNVEQFSLVSNNPEALARLMSHVQVPQTQTVSESIQVHGTEQGPSGLQMNRHRANNFNISADDSQGMERWMTKTTPNQGIKALTTDRTPGFVDDQSDIGGVSRNNTRYRMSEPLEISGNVRGRSDIELEEQNSRRERSGRDRISSFENMVPGGYSTPVDQRIPDNKSPQRPKRRIVHSDDWTPQTPQTSDEIETEQLRSDEGTVHCRCREGLIVKCQRKKYETCPQRSWVACNDTDDAMGQCPRCLGIRCPYPSFLFFR